MAVEDFLGGISRQGLCTIASRFNNGVYCSSDPMVCIPTFGTFNVVIPLHFQNGDKWIARIPRPGRMFSQPNPDLLERIMNSLAVTTSLVRERTCIPAPEIYGWSSRDDNEAGCPYMFMEFVEGKSLGDCFHELPADKLSNIIYEWATYTWELTRLTFPAIGCLGLSHDSQRVVVQKFISAGSVDQGRDAINPFFRGPYLSVADYLFGISNLKKTAPLDDQSYDRFSFGTYLESMIPFALKPQLNNGPFYLTHDDFNVQNILVNPDTGNITAILDWDYACVKPIQSLMAYPESLRWDLLAPLNPSLETYQVEFARNYRKQWADALILASKNIPTGCRVNISDILDDSPFFAELERGLGESWREAEAMKFCNSTVFGGPSSDVLKLAGRGMRSGPWMTVHGNRAGYTPPPDLNVPEPQPCPPRKQSLTIKVKVGVGIRAPRVVKKPVAQRKLCEWKSFSDKLLHRKRIRRFLGRLYQDGDKEDDDISLNRTTIEKQEGKRTSWWTTWGRRLYGVKERTMILE
jgi:hypothetical protein